MSKRQLIYNKKTYREKYNVMIAMIAGGMQRNASDNVATPI